MKFEDARYADIEKRFVLVFVNGDSQPTKVPTFNGNYLYTEMIKDGIEIAPYVAPPEPVPQTITARQLRIGLVLAEWITEAEAIAWRKGEALPAPVQTVISAMPADQQFIASETAYSMSVAERSNSLLFGAAQAAMPNATEQEISDTLDHAFREWSQI